MKDTIKYLKEIYERSLWFSDPYKTLATTHNTTPELIKVLVEAGKDLVKLEE